MKDFVLHKPKYFYFEITPSYLKQGSIIQPLAGYNTIIGRNEHLDSDQMFGDHTNNIIVLYGIRIYNMLQRVECIPWHALDAAFHCMQSKTASYAAQRGFVSIAIWQFLCDPQRSWNVCSESGCSSRPVIV